MSTGLSEDDKLVGVETICPKCDYKLYYWFRSGKQVISEFVNDLNEYKELQISKAWRYDVKQFFIKLIKKWEKRAK